MSNDSPQMRIGQARTFILAGQSNMAGAGVPKELPPPLAALPARVRLFEEGQERDLLWRPRFGPEIGLAHELARAFPDDPIILCKVARGGANLHYDWNPDGVSQGPEDEYRGPLYPRLLEALRALPAAIGLPRHPLQVCGLVWMQGERDSVFEFMARAYSKNLTAFIAAIRRDTSQAGLPCILAEVSPRVYRLAEGRFQHAFREVVREAQHTVARQDSRVGLVETMDLPQCDNLHFDTAGQILLGQRCARSLLDLIAGPTGR
jgi:hypothetical protein